MGQRLTQIATCTGDDGLTSLSNNQRVFKASARIHSLGEVDELNSYIGLLLYKNLSKTMRPLLTDIQQQLFNMGS